MTDELTETRKVLTRQQPATPSWAETDSIVGNVDLLPCICINEIARIAWSDTILDRELGTEVGTDKRKITRRQSSAATLPLSARLVKLRSSSFRHVTSRFLGITHHLGGLFIVIIIIIMLKSNNNLILAAAYTILPMSSQFTRRCTCGRNSALQCRVKNNIIRSSPIALSGSYLALCMLLKLHTTDSWW
jgi:hypothetical protein